MKDRPLITAEFAGTLVPTHSDFILYSTREVGIKAAKAFGVCWATAVAMAFVPVVHFIMSPLAIIAGPIAAAVVYYKVRKLPSRVEGTVICNHCKKETAFLFENIAPPFYQMCTHCKTGYEVLWPPQALSNQNKSELK